MCYAIPAKLIKICKNNIGIVEYFGETRRILLDLKDVKIGDYVFAQGGISVRKVPEKEALEILDTWKEIFFELKKTDIALSKVDESEIPDNVLAILQKINLRKSLTPKELRALFEMHQPNELKVLYEVANNVRQREHGNASCVHGILEFSNYCQMNCHYCGIRNNRAINRYRMTVDEIVAAAKYAIDKYGFKAFVLQSGEDYWYTDDILETLVKSIRSLGVLIFLSIGDRPASTYKRLYKAGARATLMRFETSNPELFSTLRPGTTLTQRLKLIRDLKEMGYILATGFIIGFPGETIDDRVNNILLTKQLAPDMYSFGPLIPTQGTPLANTPKIDVSDALKTIAIARLADSQSNILVTSAVETLSSNATREALLAGANSMIINLTPQQYKKLYAIYDNRAGAEHKVAASVQATINLLQSLGRAPTDLSIAARQKTIQ
jgi:biotin synthase